MKVLFLCTGNSIRSQMAEALLRHHGGGRFEVYSAGVSPAGVHPLTVQALEEEGLDTSSLHSKSIQEVPLDEIDLMITLCGHAKQTCPAIPGRIKMEHWPIDDPVRIIGTTEQRFQMFREARETIRDRILDFLKRPGAEQ